MINVATKLLEQLNYNKIPAEVDFNEKTPVVLAPSVERPFKGPWLVQLRRRGFDSWLRHKVMGN